jgi:hypothetical protein
MGFFTKKHSNSMPLLIIKKETDEINVKEYKSIDEAIVDLENDPNVPADKIEKLKSSLKNLKNKASIKIRNGEIIK